MQKEHTTIKTIRQKIIFIFDRRDYIRALILLVLMIGGGVLELVGLMLIPVLVLMLSSPQSLLERLEKHGLAYLIPSGGVERAILPFLVFLAAFFLFKNLYLSLMVWLQGRFQGLMQNKLCSRLYQSYLHAAYYKTLATNSSRQSSVLQGETPRLFNNLFTPALGFMTEIIVFIFVAGAMLTANPIIFLIAVTLIGGGTALFYFFFRRRVKIWGGELTQTGSMVSQAVGQGLTGFKEIKALGREEFFLEVYNRNALRSILLNRRLSMMVQYPKFFIETIAIFSIVVVVLALQFQGRTSASILSEITLFAVTAIRLVPSLNRLVNAATMIQGALPALDSVVADLEWFEASESGVKITASPEPFRFSKEIQFENVTFNYPKSSKPAINGVSFTVKRGETVALVGRSGAGKSTAADILLGLLEPASGRVSVDGRNIHESIRSWQKFIGYIPQTIFLCDDTLRRNIALGLRDEEIDEGKLWSAAEAAQLKELISTLPDGIDERVGERGVRLSGGQRQRIGIARALYHQPQILLMDEATSALDNQTEKQITDILGQLHGSITMIIIAHRLSTIQHADNIILFEEGKIISQGSYAELLKTSAAFQRLALVFQDKGEEGL
jgi:ATP-binding cassette subfamily C protein